MLLRLSNADIDGKKSALPQRPLPLKGGGWEGVKLGLPSPAGMVGS